MSNCKITLDLLRKIRYNNEKICKLGLSKDCLQIAPNTKQNFFGAICYPCLKLSQQKKYLERKLLTLNKKIKETSTLIDPELTDNENNI